MHKPLGNRVLVKPLKEDDITSSGLIKPESAKEKPQEGVVQAVGDKVKMVKVTDRILYGKYVGFDLKIDDDDYIMVNEEDVLAVITSD